eukprot:c21251_g1_i1.p1 GENE.c21251_g1_i1~~c21251_g1_i1.p1  ORF type:complete len:410 (-),score=125.49 c21251_g1_i1:838-2004(-)
MNYKNRSRIKLGSDDNEGNSQHTENHNKNKNHNDIQPSKSHIIASDQIIEHSKHDQLKLHNINNEKENEKGTINGAYVQQTYKDDCDNDEFDQVFGIQTVSELRQELIKVSETSHFVNAYSPISVSSAPSQKSSTTVSMKRVQDTGLRHTSVGSTIGHFFAVSPLRRRSAPIHHENGKYVYHPFEITKNEMSILLKACNRAEELPNHSKDQKDSTSFTLKEKEELKKFLFSLHSEEKVAFCQHHARTLLNSQPGIISPTGIKGGHDLYVSNYNLSFESGTDFHPLSEVIYLTFTMNLTTTSKAVYEIEEQPESKWPEYKIYAFPTQGIIKKGKPERGKTRKNYNIISCSTKSGYQNSFFYYCEWDISIYISYICNISHKNVWSFTSFT